MYDSKKTYNFATYLIVIEAKKVGSTETCLGQSKGVHEGSACLHIGRTSEDKSLSSTARLPTVSHSVSVVSIMRAIGAKGV